MGSEVISNMIDRVEVDTAEFKESIEKGLGYIYLHTFLERHSCSSEGELECERTERIYETFENVYDRIARNMNHIFEIEDENDEYYEDFIEELGRI